MTTNKEGELETKRDFQSQEPDAKKEQQPDQLKKNPNPRANGNVPDEKEGTPRPAESTGAGSEVTDGEDG